jgi:hypothetical protein
MGTGVAAAVQPAIAVVISFNFRMIGSNLVTSVGNSRAPQLHTRIALRSNEIKLLNTHQVYEYRTVGESLVSGGTFAPDAFHG